MMVKLQRNIVPVAACAGVVSLLIWMGVVVAEEVPYPVRFNPRLGLTSVDTAAIDARLHRFFWPDWPEGRGLDLYKMRPGYLSLDMAFEEAILEQALATNCIDLKAFTEAGFLGRYQNDFAIQHSLLKECEAIEMLRRARPASESFVRDFVMSAEAVHVLPVMLDTSSLADRRCEEYIANRQGVPWSRFDRIVEIDVRDEYDIHVLTEHRDGRVDGDDGYFVIGGGRVRVNILAWGDFNGDGYEDMLVQSWANTITWRPTTGTSSIASASFTNAFILTRKSPDAVLRIVDAERYLTPADKPCAYP